MEIKRLRLAQTMTQEEFAALLGVKRSTVAMWETDKNKPRAALLPRIADTLGCTVDELLRS